MTESIKNEQYCWEKEFQLKYYEMDFKRILKPSSLLNFLQDLATINADMLGFGYDFTSDKNLGWFLVRYHFEFDEYPSGLDEIIIKTEARGYAKFFAFRDFEIWTADNQTRLGRVISQWMLVDLETKNVSQIANVIDFMPVFEKRADDLLFDKVFAPLKVDLEANFEIRYDDIDVNQHVNNANYIVWAFETLTWEFRSRHKLKTLDVIFKKEIQLGADVVSKVELRPESKTTIHLLKNRETGDDLCQLKAIWK